MHLTVSMSYGFLLVARTLRCILTFLGGCQRDSSEQFCCNCLKLLGSDRSQEHDCIRMNRRPMLHDQRWAFREWISLKLLIRIIFVDSRGTGLRVLFEFCFSFKTLSRRTSLQTRKALKVWVSTKCRSKEAFLALHVWLSRSCFPKRYNTLFLVVLRVVVVCYKVHIFDTAASLGEQSVQS